MYTKSARLYDTLYGSKDYSGAAAAVHDVITQRRPGTTTLLDVACGPGFYLEVFRSWYRVEGTDINPELLRMAGQRCPGIPLHLSDMLELDLGRRFDVVTCFSAIIYLVTPQRLISAVARLAAHLEPGGLLIVEPWFAPDQYWKDSLTANFSTRESQKIAWMYVNTQCGSTAAVDVHYLVGEGQTIEYFVERHEAGLYTREDYAEAFRKAGFSWTFIEPRQPFPRGLYLASYGGESIP
jgi:SAM-dependent methyltransferase